MGRIYLCIDLKTFYASVECVERGLDPFKTDLVVADNERGKGAICLAISPKMKERGIKNRCRMWEIPSYVRPIVARPRMKKYIEYSAKVYKVYLKYVAKEDIYPYSIDEMFLDVTCYLNLYGKTPVELAKTIIDDVYFSTGITATAGIGTNLYLAKISLDIIAKKSASNIGYLNEELYKKNLWHHLPITDFWRISEGTQARLRKLKIKDMYDISHCNEKLLYKEFGINAKILIDHANGVEPCTIKDIKEYKPKTNSISNTQILPKDYDFNGARIVLIEMLDNIILQLVQSNLYTDKVVIYIGYSNLSYQSSKITIKFERLTCNFEEILAKVLEEYDYQIKSNLFIRRIGIYLLNVQKKIYEQMNLFTDEAKDKNAEKLEKTVIQIKEKFGKNSILRAVSYEDFAMQRKRNKLIGGHNAE